MMTHLKFWPVVLGVALLLSTTTAMLPFPCLTDSETRDIVTDFGIVLSQKPGYKAAAKRVLTKDFIALGDSVNFVVGIPVNTTRTHSRIEFLQQNKGLPSVGVEKELFLSHTCDTITRYFELGTTPLPVRGISIFFVNSEHKIYKGYTEVNSGALLYNLDKPECEPSFTASIGNEGPEPTLAVCSRPATAE